MADIKVKSLSVNIPDEYMKVKPLPQEDPDSIIYGTEYEESLNIMFIEELECKDSLPFGRVGMLVDIIHNSLAENQGIRDAIVFATVSPEAAGMNENGPFEDGCVTPLTPIIKKACL